MKKIVVLDENNQQVFVGTKQDCVNYVKRNALKNFSYEIHSDITTTSPQKPVGIFKRIFFRN